MPLADENKLLKKEINDYRSIARENEDKHKRIESLEFKLLAADNFTQLLDILLIHYPSLFNVDFTSLILSDAEMQFSTFLNPLLHSANYPNVKLLHLPRDIEQIDHLAKNIHFNTFEAERHAWLTGDVHKTKTNLVINSLGTMPLIRHGKAIGLFCCFSKNTDRFNSTSGNMFLQRLSNIIAICLENILNHEQLTLITFTDPLTKTRNRRYFDQVLEQEVNRSNRSQTSLSCILLDIDHFKSVNDTHGHQAGDEILVSVVKRINSVLRTHEMLARFGGEEFILILPQTANKAATQAAQRIIDIIHAKAFLVNENTSLKVTISAGVSTFTSRDTILDGSAIQEELIASADKALYTAKESGRDQVQSLGEIKITNY